MKFNNMDNLNIYREGDMNLILHASMIGFSNDFLELLLELPDEALMRISDNIIIYECSLETFLELLD